MPNLKVEDGPSTVEEKIEYLKLKRMEVEERINLTVERDTTR